MGGGGGTNPLFAAASEHEIGGDIGNQDNDQNTGKLNGTHNNKEEITFTENAKFIEIKHLVIKRQVL